MSREIEAKFVINEKIAKSFKIVRAKNIEQFYLPETANSSELSIRYRLSQSNGKTMAYKTIKRGLGHNREEIESIISFDEYCDVYDKNEEEIEKVFSVPVIQKRREVSVEGYEIDTFLKELKGLYLLEKEFETEEEYLDFKNNLPRKLSGAIDVSDTNKYSNLNLARLGLTTK